MSYHISRIVNNSPTAVVLTNPVAERDRHVVPASYGDPAIPGCVVPEYPPKIETIKGIITYPTALKKALNIYTSKNNWCFWDNGEKGATALIGAGEGEEKSLLKLPPKITDLELVISPEGVPSFIAPSPEQRTLNFKIQKQWRLLWCWAATAGSIANYYEKTEEWTPCKVASKVLGRTDCCDPTKGVNCDKAVEFDKALKEMGHLANTGGALSFFGVQQEIDAGRPVLVALKALSGHGVVITGYNNFNPKKPTIEIQDPSDGSKTVCDFATFPRKYGAGYTWVATCRTK